MDCVYILFSDHTWYACPKEDAKNWMKNHPWQTDACYKTAIVITDCHSYYVNLENDER